MGNKLTADVVVIGTGFAGLSAAVEARAQGAEVVVLGQKSVLANNSAMSGGEIAMVDTPLQRQNGVKDSAELFFNDLMKANGDTLPEDMVRAAVQGAVEQYDWFVPFGANFFKLVRWPGHSVPRVHREIGEKDYNIGRGGRIIKLMHKLAKEKGIDIRMGTPAYSLVTDSRGRVVGVKARTEEGEEVEAQARRGVVLGAGGFAKNKEMMEKYAPRLLKLPSMSSGGATGDGIRMAEEVGAELANMDSAVMVYGPSARATDKRLHQLQEIALVLGLRQGVAVNKEGRRFMADGMTYGRGTSLIMRQTDGVAFVVFDEATRTRAGFTSEDGLFAGATPEELGAKAGVDGRSLAETIAQYNNDIPKTDYYGNPVQKPPLSGRLFAIPFTGVIVMTQGGPRINTMAQVLHKNGGVIPGLYAAGDNVPGPGGASDGYTAVPGYLSGCGNSFAISFGRIAGRNAASGD